MKALNCICLNSRVVIEILNPQRPESDFDRYEIMSRDVQQAHVKGFGETIENNLQDNPDLPPLSSSFTFRIVGKNEKAEARIVKCINAGKLPTVSDIETVWIVDANHRYTKVVEHGEKGLFYKMMCNLIVCTDDEEAECFYLLNAPAKKMAAGIVDVALIRRFQLGKLESKNVWRGIAATIAHSFSDEPSPYRGHIEQPNRRPPSKKNPWLKFHRTVGAMKVIGSQLKKEVTFDEAVLLGKDVAAAWRAIGHILHNQVFADKFAYGDIGPTDHWQHGPLLSIITTALVTPVVIKNYEEGNVGKLDHLDAQDEFRKPLEDFFAWGLSNECLKEAGPSMRNGFAKMSGESADSFYVKKLDELRIKHK